MDSVFNDLHQRYHRDLFQFLFYMVKSRELAEDLVQEVYIRVLKAYQNFEGKSSEKTWLFSIARNVAIDYFRKQKSWKKKLLDTFDWNRSQLKDSSALPEEIIIQSDDMRKLYECLDHCTQDQKMVIIMRYFNELTIAETTEILGWSESKVKITQHRTLKILREMMVEKGQEGGVQRYG